MASLNTLRTKGGWIISIIIGIALLAFILPEVFRGGGGQNPNKIKVGEIDGQKVSYTEFYDESEYYNAVMSAYYGRSNFSAAEIDNINDMAWNALVMDKAYYPGFEKLGLAPLDAEQMDMVTGAYISPVIMREFTNPETGEFDRTLLAGFVSNLDLNPNGQLMWDYLKQQMKENRVLLKYMTLVAAGVNTTQMQVEAQCEASNKVYSAKVVAAPYTDIADSLVKVTSADLKKYYDTHKNAFRQAASRDIEYVVFDILPSQEDYDDAKKAVDEIAAEFMASETPMQYASLNTQSRPDDTFFSEDDMNPEIAAVIWDKPEAMYGPVLDNDVYTMARLGEVRMMPDTLGAKHILLAPTDQALADSLMDVIANGGDFGQLAAEYSIDPSGQQNMGDLGYFPPEMMINEFSEALLDHKTGDVFTVVSQFGLHIVEKTYSSPLVKKAQVAMIEYNVDPSSMTEMDIFNKARDFQVAAYGSYDNFRKAASDQMLSKRVECVTTTDRSVSGLPESKELVRWAFNNKVGDVSNEIKLGSDAYVVAVITSASEDGIAPMEQYRDEIRMAVEREKKGEILAAKMTGNNIDEVAAAVGKEVVDVEGIQFSMFSVPNVGAEPKLIGAITSGIPEGQLSKPVAGNLGVYSFVVTGATENADVNLDTERVKLQSSSEMYIDQRMMQAIEELANVKDSRIKYF